MAEYRGSSILLESNGAISSEQSRLAQLDENNDDNDDGNSGHGSSSGSGGGDDFSLIEESGLVGLFLRHEQNLDLYDWNRNAESSPTKTTRNKTGNVFGQNRVRYRLNKALFAINEPYFMKTERDSLIKYIRESTTTNSISSGTDGAMVVGSDAVNHIETNSVTEDEDGNPIVVADQPIINKSKKRKRNITKKLAYIESNLANKAERLIALKLIGKYLTEQINNYGDCSESANNSNNNNSNSNNGKSKATKKTKLIKSISDLDEKLLLSHINSNETQSNLEAQSFVSSLFRNRFESLNYRTKLFCNPFDQVLKVKFGLSNYLIPSRCSFAGVDIVEGIQMLIRYLKIASVSSSTANMISPNSLGSPMDSIPITASNLICTKNPFMIVMDPAWDRNKSVKRKRTYETVSGDYLKRMTRELATLIELVTSLKSEAMKLNCQKSQQNGQQTRKSMTNRPDILCAIWTTKADKDFVHKEMLPVLNLRCTYELKWHKITLNGLPVKIHGGLEFLILAESLPTSSNLVTNNTNTTSSSSSSSYNSPRKSGPSSAFPIKKGILVSVPSAIHSHKPSLLPLFRQLYGIRQLSDQRYRTTVTMPTSADDIFHYQMAPNEFLLPLTGLELFARYLTPGFHSIGHECIKLQNENLFVTTAAAV